MLKIRFLQALIGIILGCIMCFGGGMDAHAKAIELRFSHHLPPMVPIAKALEQWAKRLESETNGGVKIVIFPSETLAKGRDAFPSTAGGVCDIAFVNNVYESARWGLNNIVNLTALPFPPGKKVFKS
jgi:C4-dicarboxylate-binding protein DctP